VSLLSIGLEWPGVEPPPAIALTPDGIMVVLGSGLRMKLLDPG